MRSGARLAPLALLTLAGCVDATAVETAGVDVDLTDAPPSAPAYAGELTLTAETMLSNDGRGWWLLGVTGESLPNQTSIGRPDGGAGAPMLSLAPQVVTVTLQDGADAARLNTNALVLPDTYRFVRLLIHPGSVAALAGPLAGDSVSVVAGTRALVIQREFAPQQLRASGRLTVTWDLNSEAWLTPAAIAAGVADSVAVKAAAAVSVVVR